MKSLRTETSRELRFMALSPPRRNLVRLMQRIGFGHIEGLAVSGGEPVIDTQTRVVREVKFDAVCSVTPSTESDYALKQQVLVLIEQLNAIGDSRINLIEIKHGLPFRMSIDDLTLTERIA